MGIGLWVLEVSQPRAELDLTSPHHVASSKPITQLGFSQGQNAYFGQFREVIHS